MGELSDTRDENKLLELEKEDPSSHSKIHYMNSMQPRLYKIQPQQTHSFPHILPGTTLMYQVYMNSCPHEGMLSQNSTARCLMLSIVLQASQVMESLRLIE